ncbi:helicostatins-like [Ostrinia furnacalis]|uniref:helicostatins-like n=1 Tax=Ostrinia furnacalis TaxID=93504 RepID=UPI00103B682F|nr:helicostatins-like [Ostrinia furnacalis]
MLYTSIPVYFLLLGAALCAPERVQVDDVREHDAPDAPAHDLTHVAPLEKRSPHYDFGLGKRAYSYVSEYKRLPVYNFGLGKRLSVCFRESYKGIIKATFGLIRGNHLYELCQGLADGVMRVFFITKVG